ncbi:MAG: hypothetical protein AAGE13_15055 [Pseudomonadota bacterium]
MRIITALLALCLAAGSSHAGEVEIVGVEAQKTSAGWRFDVTLAHGDTGWDHYADAWELRLADGTVLGTRTLFHPHVEEQPFTRSLSGVEIPAGTTAVLVFAHDSVHGWTETPVTFSLAD